MWLRLPAAGLARTHWLEADATFYCRRSAASARISRMSESSLQRSATVRQGAYLPHWTLDGAKYHVVFRLADSLPAAVIEDYQRERAALLAAAGDDAGPAVQDRLQKLFSARIEQLLDTGRGACWLARTEIAEPVANALRHFEGTRYHLLAWCVMPNHVHAIAQPLAPHELSGILHSWKSYTATTANRLLQRSGEFWQKESFDHLIRDADELERTIRYVQANPANAGLKEWPWVWPAP